MDNNYKEAYLNQYYKKCLDNPINLELNKPMFEDEYMYKKQALKAAEGLCYGEGVIRKIKTAKSDGEIVRIMISARKEGEL